MKWSFGVITIVPAVLLGLAFAPLHLAGSAESSAADETGSEILAQAEQQPPSDPSLLPDSHPEEPQPTSLTSEPQHFGAPLALEGAPLTVDAAVASCLDTGEPCKVEGTIENVCPRSGCWFSVAADGIGQDVQVRTEHAFFVPTDAQGATAVFEGLLTLETIPIDRLQHHEDEMAEAEGREPRVIEEPETVYQFIATGAELRRP